MIKLLVQSWAGSGLPERVLECSCTGIMQAHKVLKSDGLLSENQLSQVRQSLDIKLVPSNTTHPRVHLIQRNGMLQILRRWPKIAALNTSSSQLDTMVVTLCFTPNTRTLESNTQNSNGILLGNLQMLFVLKACASAFITVSPTGIMTTIQNI